MSEFINPAWGDFLKTHNLDNFEDLWSREEPWFEEPNEGRSKDGWSGVCRFEVAGKSFFLKKQENFLTYSVKNPLGIPMAEKEFTNLKLFNELEVPSMTVVYFGSRKHSGKLQALIMTEELYGYEALSDLLEKWAEKKPSREKGTKL